jgi:hypothetical protein
MIKTSFAVCGFRVIVDGNENRASLIDVLDDFHVQQLPVVLPRLSALWVLTRAASDPAQVEGTVTMTLNGKVLHSLPLTINFADQLRARAIIGLADQRVEEAGDLEFRFELRGSNAPATVIGSRIYVVGGATH